MVFLLIGSAANLVWSTYDSAVSIIKWKKARDSNQPHPFHLIPSYKYKNSKLLASTATTNIFSKAADNINFSNTKNFDIDNNLKGKMIEETNLTRENSSDATKPKR